MIFIESPIFTVDVERLLDDASYTALQLELAARPDAGDLIQGTGGLRKIRWTLPGKGKRGGTRVIYYHMVDRSQIRLILIYAKGMKDDLTPREKAILRKLNEEW
jgi:hypothetical protein